MHGGILSFTKNRAGSLARELIQNSLDASDDSGKPVKVCFSLRKDVEFGRDQLRATFEQCREALKDAEGDDLDFIEKGLRILNASAPIASLVVEDFNTVGLAGDRLDLLIGGDAVSFKDDPASLGNRGVGKYAAFANSDLSTVLYTSQYRDENSNEVRAFQGKASLVSHGGGRRPTLGRFGYYGVDEWEPHREPAGVQSSISENIRRNSIGTSVIIAGFRPSPGWRRDLAASILENFYVAVLRGRLEVEVHGGKNGTQVIDQSSIAECFERARRNKKASQSTKDAYESFLSVLDEGSRAAMAKETLSGELSSLGLCKFWFRQADGLPNRVEIVRQPGMLIFDGVRKLPRITNLRRYWGDFAAVVVCEAPKGNEMLRKMEPAQHDDLRPDMINDENEREKGEKALAELGAKIRAWLDAKMPRPDSKKSEKLDELERFFPSRDEEQTDPSDEIDPFGDVTIGGMRDSLPVVHNAVFPVPPSPVPSPAPTPGRWRVVPVSEVRFRRNDAHEARVSFTPRETANVRLDLLIAGEEHSADDLLEITSIRDLNDAKVEQGQISLTEHERVTFTFGTEQPFPAGRALLLVARTRDPKAK